MPAADFAKLRLKHHGDPAMMEKILQMECREKTRRKLPALSAIEGFRFPSLAVAEMSTSEDVAEIHAAMVAQGAEVVDMTAGLGVDAFAMARKGCRVTAFEIDPHTAEALRANVALLGLDAKVVEGDSLEWLADEGAGVVDCIFIDPARRDSKGRHYALGDCHPDVTAIMPRLLGRARKVVVKTSPMVNLNELDAYGAETVVIGTRTECKEVVFILGSEAVAGRVSCMTVGAKPFVLDSAREQTFALPAEGMYLLEPSPAVMKAGGEVRMEGVSKLHRFSHLYVSADVPSGFPGEARLITGILPFDKKNIRSVRERWPRINVCARNFPLSAPDLAKRLKITEGGTAKLYGTTLKDGQLAMIVAG